VSADEQPIPYALTERGWTAVRVEALTAGEAADRLGVRTAQVARLATRGELEGVKVEGQWLIDGASVAAYDAVRGQRRPTRWVAAPRLPAGPLLRQIELRGGVAACGVEANSTEEKAIGRAQDEGSLTLRAADHLAVRVLRMTPLELWGGDWEV
jgi:excisionase family DNA binding protein